MVDVDRMLSPVWRMGSCIDSLLSVRVAAALFRCAPAEVWTASLNCVPLWQIPTLFNLLSFCRDSFSMYIDGYFSFVKTLNVLFVVLSNLGDHLAVVLALFSMTS